MPRSTRAGALAALGGLLCAPTVARAQSPAPELLVMRLASSPADDTMPVIVAQQNGAFARAGLDVQLSRAASGSAVASAVAGGAIDIGKSSIVSVILARSKGLPFVWVAPASMYNPAQPDGGLIVLTTSTLTGAHDLNGKIVGVPALGDLNTVATRAWVDQNGGDSKTVQFVEIPVAAQFAALQEGRIVAAAIINPFLSDALNSGKAKFFASFYSSIATHLMLSGWFTTEDYAAHHREAIGKFQQIVDTASHYTNTHHAETAPLLATWSGVTLERAAHLGRMTNGYRIDPAEIQPVIDALAKYALIPKPFEASEMIVPPPR